MKKILLVTTFALSLGLVTEAQAGVGLLESLLQALGLLDPTPGQICKQKGGVRIRLTQHISYDGYDFGTFTKKGCCLTEECLCTLAGVAANRPCCPVGSVWVSEPRDMDFGGDEQW